MPSTLRAHWRRKAALSLGLTIAFCLPYFLLQQVVLFPVRRLPLSALDSAIAFNPHWVWVYQSVYLLVSIVPWFADSVEDLDRYARGFLLQAYLGFAVFLLLPIAGPRPVAVSGDAMFRLLLSYDSPLNSFPSLHVGLAAYTVFVAAALARGRLPRTPRVAVNALLTVWCLAIAYSAIATRQHYAVDLPAGALLAWLCYRWFWSRQPVRGVRAAQSQAAPLAQSERSAHAEAPGARVSAGRLPPLWNGGRVPPTAGGRGESSGGSRPRVAPCAESGVRTGGA
jgi:membrane-associated phospholipid phosphatase